VDECEPLNKGCGKWQAVCKKKHLGYHATEEAAARAYNIEAARIGRAGLNVIAPADDTDDYAEDGVAPVKRREGSSSQFKGVSWNKRRGKWAANCNQKHLGYHTTEAAAARAFNTEAERIGRTDLNVIACADDADDADAEDGDDTAAPAALALLTLAASAAAGDLEEEDEEAEVEEEDAEEVEVEEEAAAAAEAEEAAVADAAAEAVLAAAEAAVSEAEAAVAAEAAEAAMTYAAGVVAAAAEASDPPLAPPAVGTRVCKLFDDKKW
jgi:hypothetical protein